MELIDLKAQQARLRPEIEKAMIAVLDHGRYIMGPEVAELEAALAAVGGDGVTAVSCASGTDAILLALMALEVGPGDAVFVPGFTFPATAEAVALLGATPVFVDVEADTFNLDPAALAEAVAALPDDLRPAGVLPVDLYGLPLPATALGPVVDEAEMWVVSDAAQSFGGRVGGQPVGSLAPITTTSFFPAKPLGCYGDGGAVLTTDPDIAQRVRSLRVHGAGTHKYDIERIGINGRLDTLQAAILLVKLTVFADEIVARQEVAARYGAGLADVAGVQAPVLPDGVTSAWAQYTVRVADRDRVAADLKAAGVPTAVYYPRPLHHQAPYAGFWRGHDTLPVAELLAGEVLSLPMHPYLTAADQDRVVEALAEATARS